MKGENTMNKIKKYIVTTVMALAMVLPIIQPLAVHAEETGAQVIKISGNCEYVQNGYNVKQSYSLLPHHINFLQSVQLHKK